MLLAERWIIAALRHRTLFSLSEANQAILELLDRLNHRPFHKRDGSRSSLFEEVERAVLRPLPPERFDLSQWSRAKVKHAVLSGACRYRSVKSIMENSSQEIFNKPSRP